MRLLITGGSGFLGRRAAAWLAAQGWQVLAPTRDALPLTDPAAVRAWFAAHRPQAVLHCAAISDVGACQRQPQLSLAVNHQATVLLADLCAATGAKLVFCSSDQVYGGSPLPGPHAEDEPLSPPTWYGRHKLAAEAAVTACGGTSLRLTWLYDTSALPGEHGNLMQTLLAALRALPAGQTAAFGSQGQTAPSAAEGQPTAAPGSQGQTVPPAAEGQPPATPGVHTQTAPPAASEGQSQAASPAAVLRYPIHDTRGLTDVQLLLPRLSQALALPAGAYNFGCGNDKNTYQTMQTVFARLGAPAHLLAPDAAPFADAPRNIAMRPDKAAAHGVSFPTTADALCAALERTGVFGE